mgnify:CR=1 FL=1
MLCMEAVTNLHELIIIYLVRNREAFQLLKRQYFSASPNISFNAELDQAVRDAQRWCYGKQLAPTIDLMTKAFNLPMCLAALQQCEGVHISPQRLENLKLAGASKGVIIHASTHSMNAMLKFQKFKQTMSVQEYSFIAHSLLNGEQPDGVLGAHRPDLYLPPFLHDMKYHVFRDLHYMTEHFNKMNMNEYQALFNDLIQMLATIEGHSELTQVCMHATEAVVFPMC